jgi:hypothetical protein
MAPSIDGEPHHFSEHGLYDGLFLMRDEESGTFWDHMTGEAVYGELVGRRLPVSELRQTTVAQVFDEDRDAMVALSDQALRRDADLRPEGLLASVRARLNGFFSNTIEAEDDRRPTMDLGLGLWEDEYAIYYPYETIVDGDRAVLGTFRGRGVLVYLDPTSRTLAAYYTGAEAYEWDDDVLRLSDGTYIESGVLRGPDGERLRGRRPLQVFTRWYGFSLTFPDVPIYGAGG